MEASAVQQHAGIMWEKGWIGMAKMKNEERNLAGAEDSAADGKDSEAVNETDVGAAEIEVLEAKAKKLEEQLLRTAAELQNFQKRAEREKADIASFAITKFAKDVLAIFDNLQLALTSCGDEKNPIVEGIKLTLSQMNKVLGAYDIRMIESSGKKFDPNYHQAMTQVEADAEAGTIVQVMQEGFMIKDRLLRPALVSVAK